MGKFEIFSSPKDGKYYFRLKAGNGQVILTSQGYLGKSGCTKGIKSIVSNCTDESLYERKEGKNGKFHFNLLAKNKQIIGSSQMYKDKTGMESGIKSVMKNAPEASINVI